MTLCARCGTTSEDGLCAHHPSENTSEWAIANRIWCNFFHRGIPIKRLPAHQREDDFWGIDTPPTQDNYFSSE